MYEATMNSSNGAGKGILRRGAGFRRLALKVLLVGFVCHFATEIGFAFKFPPHYISPLWPTGAILFSVLVVTPIRHWWAYILAAYFTSVVNDARAGFPVAAILFVIAGLIEICIAALGVRRFAGGLRAFDSLRCLVVYILVAVVLAPFVSAFVAAFAGIENYWFYWRVWFLSEALAYLMLAPAILTWIAGVRLTVSKLSPARWVEACLIGFAVLAISVRVFAWPALGESSVPALVYSPLPFLLLAAVRFGPVGVNSCLLVVAFLSISGAVRGHGPFTAGTADDSVLPLQLFLVTVSVPLMLLAALIQERREKTNALRESEERMSLVANTAGLGLWVWDATRDDSWVTPEGRRLFGWTESEPVTLERFVRTLHPDDREPVRHAVLQSLQRGNDYVAEYRVVLSDGSIRWIATHGRIEFNGNGSPRQMRGVSVDITQQKKAESEVQQQRTELAHVARISTMGELAASLAHELNQPLTAILANAQAAQRFLASNPADVDEVREVLKDIVQEDNRASEVIRRMRALVRKEELEFVPLDLANVIRDVVLLVHSDVVMRNIHVSLEFDPVIPSVRCDKIALQQVVLNILLNAFDAMKDCPAHEREVLVRVERDGARMVKVAVSDHGTGLSADKLDKVFQPFYTTKRDGLGMGLSISRSIIDAHGGRLWAENKPKQGATFYFTMPVEGAGERGEIPNETVIDGR
jgi:PAS domain S-box-containing protein